MKQIFDYARLALVTFALILMPLAGCSPPLSQEAQAQRDALLAQIQQLEASIQVYDAQLAGMEPGTPQHVAVQTQKADAIQAGAAAETALADLEVSAANDWLESAMDFAGIFIPGSEAFEPAVMSLGLLAFERPRDKFLQALQSLNPVGSAVAPVEALKHLAGAVGLIDSTEAGRIARLEAQRERTVAKAEAKTAKVKGASPA